MKKILKYVPGFRSDTKWKKIVAAIFYVFITIMSLIVGTDFFFIIGGLGLLVISIVDLIKKRKAGQTIKVAVISIVAAVILMNVGLTLDDTETEIAKTDDEGSEVEIVKKEEPEEVKGELDITGDMDIQFSNDKTIVTINTNAIDGTIFETLITDADFNVLSDFIEVKDGKAIKEFETNEEWKMGYLSSITSIRFDLDEHPQPEKVKELYGENGENLKGELAVENNLGGYNISLESKTIAYPDEATVKEEQDKLFTEAIGELKEISDGIITGIQPRFTDGDWTTVAITVSDAWYNSEEYEKERFAETIGDTVQTVIVNTGRVSDGKNVMIYFFDSYQKELASPKITGGYKIKR